MHRWCALTDTAADHFPGLGSLLLDRLDYPTHCPNGVPLHRDSLDVPSVSVEVLQSRPSDPKTDEVSLCSEWPWVQSGFLTLHALTMLMKVHSYCSLNGELRVLLRSL